MQQQIDTLLSKAHLTLQNIYGKRLDKVILFGSYARGEQSPESDIDLLVVLNDAPLETGKEIRTIVDSLFTIGLQYNTSISAHPVSSKRFENEPSFFYQRIKKEGRVL